MEVEAVDGGREEVAEIMDGVAQLRADVRADEVDLGGEPEGFQGGDHSLADTAFLAIGVFRVFVADEFVVKRALAGADGLAFRLGGVGRKDGLDVDILENGEDLFRIEADGL